MIKKLWFAVCTLFVAHNTEAQTAVTNVIDSFSTNSYLNGSITSTWKNWFGGAFQSLSFDPASDANTNPASGSLKIVCNYPVNDQFTVWNGITGINPPLSGIIYTNLQCDVRFAAGSATNTSGNNYGNLQFGMGTPTSPGWGQDYWNNGFTVPVGNTNWVHVSIPLSSTDTNIQQYGICNVFIHIWSGTTLAGPSTLWVDNIKFIGTATNTGAATIDYTNTQQRIDGFGASSAWYFSPLSTSDADLLFSTNTGAGLSLLRTRIAPGGVIDDSEGTIAQEATARGARVWSTPWSPPATFKNTNTVNGGSFVSSTANYQGYAAQLANYAAVMKNSYGVNLLAVSLQNEPDAIVNYESCWWTSQQFHDFIPYLATALTASNVASTQIMLPEDEHWQFNLATNTMNDITTSNLVGILGGHNYGSSAAPVTQFGSPCPKTLWETEHYLGTDDSITNGLQLAQEIHSFMTVAQVNAYLYWWLIGNGTGSIADNTANPAKRLFVMGNYSKFVRPNYYRVGLTNTSTALITAYKDSGSSNFVIVAANPSAISVNQTFTITNFPGVGPLRQWVTSATESLANHGGAISLTNGTFTTVLPPWTVITFLYQSPVTNPPSILQQPANQIALPGDMVSFAVQATGGSAPLYYQWFFNGTNSIAAATNAMLTLTSAALTNAGNYSVIITNYAGSVTSSLATLSFITINWSAPVTILNGADVSTNGISLYAYNNSGSSATISNVTFTGVNSSTAWGTGVTLGGWTGTATSAFVGGSVAPWNTLPAAYQTILQGAVYNNGGIATVTLNNLTIGHPYQVQVWVNDSRSGGTTNRTETLPGAAGSTVTLAYNSQQAGGGLGQYTLGSFTATATNQSFTLNGAASTQLNALQVRDVSPIGPSIVQQPTNQAAWTNSSATFSVGAAGTGPLAYQWLFNGTNNLPGATNANLTLTGLAVTNAGNYSVVVTNIAGSVTSAVATLTISTDANFVLKANDLSGGSSFNAIGNWTNSASGAAATFAPASGYTYRTGPFALRTPAAAGNYQFAGSTLNVSPGGSLNISGGGGNLITISNLLFSGTINDLISPNQIAVLAGKMTVVGAGSLNTQAALNDARGITNSLTLSGTGTLTNLGLGTGPGFVVYTGTNTAFTGPLIITSNTTLQAASPANLGGNPPSFNPAQLVLDNGALMPTASFAMTNGNSGITLNTNGGTFNLTSGITLTVSNPIAGAGSLLKTGAGTLILAGINTYSGTTTVSNGMLALLGNADLNSAILTLTAGASLDVSGLNVPLTISNQISLAGNLIVTANSAGTSSKLMVSNLVFGGTLAVSNSGPTFVAGNSFTFFTASNYSGAFTNITPATPGAGLAWDTTKLASNGILAVGMLPTVSITPASTNLIYGNTLVLNANATGTGTLAYQWYDNHTNAIPGAVYASFTNTPAVAGSGNYGVMVTNAVGLATNYAAVTVNPAGLTVTADSTNRLYGATNPVFTASFSGLVNGDTLSSAVTGSPALSTSANNGSGVGSYAIVAANGTLGAANYIFSYNSGILTIYPATLSLTANSTNKLYGSPLVFAGTEYTVAGLTNSDTIASATLSSAGTNATATIGNYPIAITNASGSGLTNYSLTYIAGTLTVTKAALTVTANSAGKVYGSNLTFAGTEFTTAGLTNSDTVTNVTLASLGTVASAAVGSYPITITNALGLGLTNYFIAYTNGNLTVLGSVAMNPTNILIMASYQGLQLSWPADHLGWWLQSQTNHLGTNWFNVPGSSATNMVLLPLDVLDGSVFYRLISP